jgi:hypothetical protein
MRLYRGLNLDRAEIEFIRNNGDMSIDVGSWLLKPLIDHHNLSVEEIKEKILIEPHDIERYDRNSKDILNVGKYVTGCALGASTYSFDNNEKEDNVILELECDLNQVFIDGRDFLYNSFPRLIKQDQIEPKLKSNLVDVFGRKILQYVDMAKELEIAKQFEAIESSKIFRLVDYVCMDTDVIKSHLKNKDILIQGRYSTRFLSAFAIIGGIKPEMIIDIRKSDSINRQTSIDYLQNHYNIKSLINIYEIN